MAKAKLISDQHSQLVKVAKAVMGKYSAFTVRGPLVSWDPETRQKTKNHLSLCWRPYTTKFTEEIAQKAIEELKQIAQSHHGIEVGYRPYDCHGIEYRVYMKIPLIS